LTAALLEELKTEADSLKSRESKDFDEVAVPAAESDRSLLKLETPPTVKVPLTVRVAVGEVVPMPTSVPLSKRIEFTMVFAPENLATRLGAPPVVVTVVAGGVTAA